MSISNAMQSGVSGLSANSTAVEKISTNIANANTDGYRRSFAQMITNSVTNTIGGVAGNGVRTAIAHENDIAGSFRSTGQVTNLAINGAGFFVVTRTPAEAGEQKNALLTRTGSFMPDAEGNLRNAAGLYLAGFPFNDGGTLGMIDRNQTIGLATVNVGSSLITGGPSSTVAISGNLPAQETGLGIAGDPFLSSVEYYSPLGAAERLQFSWQPTIDPNRWSVAVTNTTGSNFGSAVVDFADSGPLAGSPLAYSNIVNTSAAPESFSLDPATGMMTLTINNGATPQTIAVSLGEPGTFAGLTQFAGDYAPLSVVADGAQSGTMMRVEFDQSGDVWGFFDNGARKALFSIPLAEVTNPNGLVTHDNSTFILSRDSGNFRLSTAETGTAGSINSGGVESSNVDIANELTELIQKQRAYSSNAKIITTADEMLDETMRLKR